MADAPPARRSRIPKILFLTVILALVVAVSWVAFLNWRKDGAFSFHVFDSAWWRPGMSGARPMLDGAKQATSKANDALWGSGGLVDQAEKWLNGKVARNPSAASAPATPTPTPTQPSASEAPPVATVSPDAQLLKKCERAIVDAEVDFQVGLDHYRRASPQGDALTASQREHLREARTRLLSAKDLLDRTIDPYSGCAGHDAGRLEDAKALRQYNERLLVSLNKLADLN